MNKLNNKNVGLGCAILGGIFFVAGIVLFILYNSVNLYAQKAEATIVSRYNIESEEDNHVMLELAYRVGDEMVYTAYSVDREIEEEETLIDIYYNIKDPKQVLEAGWHLEPIIPSCFGILILLTGLYYMGIVSFGLEPAKKPGAKATEWEKKYYDARERTENSLIPLLGIISFIVFGVFMLVNKSGWWAWIFVVVGALGAIYLLADFIPAVNEFIALKRLKKIKKHTLSVDDDFESFELERKGKKSVKEGKKEEKSEEKKDGDFEIEETYEIKSLDPKKNKKKKK
ncbi:MAG: hypothetical protein K5988_00250 [Lachnospiraceae bacterium]|nr:hypothetical protein [Lachnospiraceae bacterium]